MCFFILHMRLRVHRAPGIPHALTYSGRIIPARLGRSGVAGLRRCVALCVALANARTDTHNGLLEQQPLASVPNREAAAYGSPRPVRNCAPGGDDVESGERLKSSERV